MLRNNARDRTFFPLFFLIVYNPHTGLFLSNCYEIDVVLKMNSSIDNTKVLVANLKPVLDTMATLVAGFAPKSTIENSEPDC